jgi:bifunctional DNA-binding transcriptional regulator/antitoxin component of YhaV-PrlF toxin-antitoxin module
MIQTVVLDEDGAIVLPEAICKEHGLNAGDPLTVSSDKNSIRIMSKKVALESIRADIIKQHGSPDGLQGEF